MRDVKMGGMSWKRRGESRVGVAGLGEACLGGGEGQEN